MDKQMLRTTITQLRQIALFAVGVSLLTACGNNQSGMKLGDNEFAVLAVNSTTSDQTTSYPATIRGTQDIEVRPQVSGFIVKLCVDEGATVRKGQALFQIDPTQYAAAVGQAKAAVEMAKANVATLTLTEKNKKALFDQKIISDFEYQTAVNQLMSAKASLAQAEASLVSANQNLEAMAKQFYDYWFVQFDFPNEEGKPYKSSGGKMVWNEKLKRNIPVGWHCGNLFEIAVFTNGLACQKFRPKDDEESLPVIKIREMHDGISDDTEEVTSNIPESVKVYNGDVLFSWSASLEVMLWAYGLGGLNQHIFKVTSANDFPKSFYYFQLLDYIDVFKKVAEARKTTMGHITQDHLQQSTIAIPDNKDIAVRFEELISPIFEQVVKLHEEISYLIKQRDELLPLLMNGQVSVNSDLSDD